jgi:hypothetical protein
MKFSGLALILVALALMTGCIAPKLTTIPVSSNVPAATFLPGTSLPTSSSPSVSSFPVLTLSKPPTSTAPATNSVPIVDKVIRLYYYGVSTLGGDPAAAAGPHIIYSATSNDGINFQEEPSTRFSYDSGNQFGITDPDVVHLNDGSWLMFLSLGTQLLKATSPVSAGTFIYDKSFNWNNGGVPGSYNFNGSVRTFVSYQGGIHGAVYDQVNGTLKYTGIALKTPSSGIIADPSVIGIDNQFFMIYKYAQSPSAPPSEHEIYMAASADGITWSQHSQNRFICKGSVPGAVYFNDVIYIYFCGIPPKPGAPSGDMGVAISKDKGNNFTISTISIRGKVSAGVVDPTAVVVSLNESKNKP